MSQQQIEPSGELGNLHCGPITIRDLPGLMELEGKAILYGAEGLEAEAGKFTQRHFGIDGADLVSAEIGAESLDIEDVAAEFASYPHQLLTSYLMDDEITAVMLLYGLDFRDGRGQPLKCIHLIAGPAEAALKGIAGHLPDMLAVQADRFGDEMKAHADTFLANKRRPR